MNTIYNKKRGGQLSLFNNACILFVLIQFIACTCGNDSSDDESKAGEGVTTQTTQQKPALTLTGPEEVMDGPNTIILDLEVNDTLNTNDYRLEAKDLNNYETNGYTKPVPPQEGGTTVSAINDKTLQVLTGVPVLNKGDKKTISIPVTWTMTEYSDDADEGGPVIYCESAEFQFAILDKAGNTVAGPIEVKWTCASLEPDTENDQI